MLKPSRKKLFLLSAIIAVSGIIAGTMTFAEGKKPARGTIAFGATEKPMLKSSPQLESFKSPFAENAEKVVPTGVSITLTKIDTVTYEQNPFYQFFGSPFGDDDNPFGDFFGMPQQRRSPHARPPAPQKRFIPQHGLGSGVIVSKDGFILTNYHVVNGADEIEVKLSDGRSFKAKIIGSDSLSDVAVIKLQGDVKNLPVAYLGNSDKLRVGDWVLAVGNPFNLTSTVTSGIVSALGRHLDEGTASSPGNMYQNFIQIDAAINPGNSGGALVNIDGELVGINTMIMSRSGGFMGIGFAVPIAMARKVMEDIIYEGRVTRGWLGIMIQDLNEPTREALDLGSVKGVLVSGVNKDQPADKAGVRRGDIILSIGGIATGSANELKNAVAAIRPGEKTPVVVMRSGKQLTLSAVIAERNEKNLLARGNKNAPNQENENASAGNLGLKVGPITAALRQQLGLEESATGVVVLDVAENSAAAEQGIQPNDVISQINQQPVTSVKDYNQITRQMKNGQSVLLLIEREGNTFFVAFKLNK
ncbi:MAG: DegQ family serine endoprotease [Chitinivibrionales bacterium]|nr:DegQ family serine endoprotease [Chitinivibrionales bacterium]